MYFMIHVIIKDLRLYKKWLYMVHAFGETLLQLLEIRCFFNFDIVLITQAKVYSHLFPISP